MIQLNFLNAVVEDDGHGLIVNGKELRDIISMSLGAIKKVPGRYEYLGDENKGNSYRRSSGGGYCISGGRPPESD